VQSREKHCILCSPKDGAGGEGCSSAGTWMNWQAPGARKGGSRSGSRYVLGSILGSRSRSRLEGGSISDKMETLVTA